MLPEEEVRAAAAAVRLRVMINSLQHAVKVSFHRVHQCHAVVQSLIQATHNPAAVVRSCTDRESHVARPTTVSLVTTATFSPAVLVFQLCQASDCLVAEGSVTITPDSHVAAKDRKHD